MARPRKKPPRSPELAALGEAVERLRARRNLTQEQVGDPFSLDHQVSGPIERGQSNPTYLTLVRLAKALKTTPGEIVALADQILAEKEAPAAQPRTSDSAKSSSTNRSHSGSTSGENP